MISPISGLSNYLIEIILRIVDVNLVLRTCRTPDAGITRHSDILANDKELKITGRILLNVWRVMRSEISTLTSFTFENVCYEVLKERLPYFSYSTLTQWWNTTSNCSRWRVVEYYANRARYNVILLNQLDIIGKTSEMARLFGIQFLEVMTRGSQFRVESILLRLSKAGIICDNVLKIVGIFKVYDCVKLDLLPILNFRLEISYLYRLV